MLVSSTEGIRKMTNKQKQMNEVETGYEYDNIQDKLNRMTEVELQSDYAHKLMDRAAQIREEWRK